MKEKIPGEQGGWAGPEKEQTSSSSRPHFTTSQRGYTETWSLCLFSRLDLRLHFLTSQVEREPDLAPKHSASLNLFSLV